MATKKKVYNLDARSKCRWEPTSTITSSPSRRCQCNNTSFFFVTDARWKRAYVSST